MKNNLLALLVILICTGPLRAQQEPAMHVYPTHWFTGMKDSSLQLLIHGEGIGAVTKVTTRYPGIRISRIKSVENRNYLFIDLVIARNAAAGRVRLTLSGGEPASRTVDYPLKAKDAGDGRTRIRGVDQADLVYLLMPDRFANGDPGNDAYPEMRDTVADRSNPFARHGGDLAGIAAHLDYLRELGVTTIWPTPVVENDMKMNTEGSASRSSYHGYAFTDHYTIDRRLGGNEAYKALVKKTHEKGMKFIQDAVYNHVGSDHWFIRDMPMKDWVNQWPSYTNTSYKDQPVVDPHAAEWDIHQSVNGWFTRFMPDLNQRNPLVARFLIQYAIWATEEFGIDGWRVDTYFYSDPEFLNRINAALLREFPHLTVFGEAWVSTVINSAYFAQNNLDVPFKHNLQGVTDFPLFFAMLDGLRQPFGWSEGVNRVYSTLAQDLVYKDPSRNCIFLDNHDLDRVYSVIGEDPAKYRMAINWLLTLRGIPQLYYGTEILMKNFKNPSDAEVRRDFMGGWAGDSANKFMKTGRTTAEQEAFTYVSTLANFRKGSSAITRGKLMQYVPQDGVYVYFRYDNDQTVAVISNTSSVAVKLDPARFIERVRGFTRARDVITGSSMLLSDVMAQPGEGLVLELQK